MHADLSPRFLHGLPIPKESALVFGLFRNHSSQWWERRVFLKLLNHVFWELICGWSQPQWYLELFVRGRPKNRKLHISAPCWSLLGRVRVPRALVDCDAKFLEVGSVSQWTSTGNSFILFIYLKKMVTAQPQTRFQHLLKQPGSFDTHTQLLNFWLPQYTFWLLRLSSAQIVFIRKDLPVITRNNSSNQPQKWL